MSDIFILLAVAAGAGLASPAGGLIAIWCKPTTLFMSITLGFAAGILLGTIAFKMLPEALQLSGLALTIAGFVLGLLGVYALDLFIHRGRVAGRKSEQHSSVSRFHHRNPPHGDKVTVLAGGTSVEELIEGVSIGVGANITPGLGLLIGLAIAIDNIAEGMSIGELVQDGDDDGDNGGGSGTKRILGWTSLIGVALFVSTLAGWFLLRGLPQPALGFLLGAGAGGMFYLVVTDFVPESEERQYQQSSALAAAGGFVTSMVLSKLV